MNEYPFPPIPGLWSPLQQVNSYTPTALNSVGVPALPRMFNADVQPISSQDSAPNSQTNITPYTPTSDTRKKVNVPQKGIHLNYDHIFASNVIGAFGQYLANNSENSYQNAQLRFDKEKFNPLNYLPENPNVSKQALYGLDEFSEGGEVQDDPKKKKGPAPITTNNPNDPRLRAYQDSLSLYTNYNNVTKSLEKSNYKLDKNAIQSWMDYDNRLNHVTNIFPNMSGIRKESETIESVDDFITGTVNKNLPRQLFSRKIRPSGVDVYKGKVSKGPNIYVGDGQHDQRKLFDPAWYESDETLDARVVARYDNVNPKQEVKYIPTSPQAVKKSVQPVVYQGSNSVPSKPQMRNMVVGTQKDFDRLNAESPLIKNNKGEYENDLGITFKFAPKPEPRLTRMPTSPIDLIGGASPVVGTQILPINSTIPQAENNYRVEYRDENGNLTHRDFPNEKMGTQFQKAMQGERTGYYLPKQSKGGFIEGEEYDLSSEEIEQLILQGYEIEKL